MKTSRGPILFFSISCFTSLLLIVDAYLYVSPPHTSAPAPHGSGTHPHISYTIRRCSDVSDVSGVSEAVRIRRLSDSLMSNPPTTPEDIRTLSEPRTRVPISPSRLHCRRLLSDDGRRSEMAGATYILILSHPSPSSRPLGLWD